MLSNARLGDAVYIETSLTASLETFFKPLMQNSQQVKSCNMSLVKGGCFWFRFRLSSLYIKILLLKWPEVKYTRSHISLRDQLISAKKWSSVEKAFLGNRVGVFHSFLFHKIYRMLQVTSLHIVVLTLERKKLKGSDFKDKGCSA